MIRTVPARLGLVCGLLAVPCLALPAVAEEGMFFKDMMGTMGIIPKSKEPIAYRDRAPLVVPPGGGQLRTPGTRAGAANPAWPNDPDVAARRRAAAEAGILPTQSETRRMSENNPRLSPTELQAGRVASHAKDAPGSHRGDNARDVLLLSPDQLRAGARTEEPDNGAAPTRRALTDPPSGMRQWAGGKAVKGDFAPVIDQQKLDANPMTWLTRKFTSEDED